MQKGISMKMYYKKNEEEEMENIKEKIENLKGRRKGRNS